MNNIQQLKNKIQELNHEKQRVNHELKEALMAESKINLGTLMQSAKGQRAVVSSIGLDTYTLTLRLHGTFCKKDGSLGQREGALYYIDNWTIVPNCDTDLTAER